MMKPRTRNFAGMPAWATAGCAQSLAHRCIIAKPCARLKTCGKRRKHSAAVWLSKARPMKYKILCRAFRSIATASVAFTLVASLLLVSFDSSRTLAASREPVRARHGIVASTNEIASNVGVDIMKRGGNAVDAAIAVAFALAVTHPAAGNLGGGGFMMIRLKDGRTTAIDYREMAPAAASRNIHLDKNGNRIQSEGGSIVGYLAAGVPGTVRGMELALKKYGSGKFSWSQLIEPARRLAANGFIVTDTLSRSLRGNREYIAKYSETKRIYLNNGRFYNQGDTSAQPELAATFARFKQCGRNLCYTGQTGQVRSA